MRDLVTTLALLPERWLLPPPPSDARLRARWQAHPFSERRRLARVSVDPALAEDCDDPELVRALAAARVATAWRGHAMAVLLGWLVLMTVWGFGRSAAPASAGVFGVVGLVGGLVAGVAAAASVRRRTRRAATVITICGG